MAYFLISAFQASFCVSLPTNVDRQESRRELGRGHYLKFEFIFIVPFSSIWWVDGMNRCGN